MRLRLRFSLRWLFLFVAVSAALTWAVCRFANAYQTVRAIEEANGRAYYSEDDHDISTGDSIKSFVPLIFRPIGAVAFGPDSWDRRGYLRDAPSFFGGDEAEWPTEEVVLAVLQRSALAHLKSIDLSGLHISDKTIDFILPRFPELKSLAIGGTDVSDKALNRIQTQRPGVSIWAAGRK